MTLRNYKPNLYTLIGVVDGDEVIINAHARTMSELAKVCCSMVIEAWEDSGNGGTPPVCPAPEHRAIERFMKTWGMADQVFVEDFMIDGLPDHVEVECPAVP